ncbi:MAG TPA: chromosome segregation protein SMC [Solirubrobacteraceae bacterium]|jgi:chromosome segregation protein|nr:chromosome segregation protein SMC [Solirubrobacteraceae bacterium]
MHLKSLTLKGFKSFPDRTRLDFGPGVSVVVGPNGSGKSNVTDALLWAMGEQSPLAVRGSSMQDVIFGGGRGVQARSAAEVEIVLDNSDGTVELPFAEISIVRRLDRGGEGEYRLNGARCRLVDVIEVLSDTGLGKETHSVISQGRVEAIVTSKPRDRRLLIEEAAGLGKHRKRRRRAQLKLERTQENLDRALDVEREARTRLRPLKRQAEAAELHERLERQSLEARLELAREAVRATTEQLAEAEQGVGAARAAREQIDGRLAEVVRRRGHAEAALAERAERHDALAKRVYDARSARERLQLRGEQAASTAATLSARAERIAIELGALEPRPEEGKEALVATAAGANAAGASAAHEQSESAAQQSGEQRLAALEAELAELDLRREEQLQLELEELRGEQEQAATRAEQLGGELSCARAEREQADAAATQARAALREAETAADAARREAARVGAELAAANQFLRSHAGAALTREDAERRSSPESAQVAGAPIGQRALSDVLQVAPGYELALAAALGGRLDAALVADLASATSLLDRAGQDGGAALLAGEAASPAVQSPTETSATDPERAAEQAGAAATEPPADGAVALAGLLSGTGPVLALARGLLADAWVVDAIEYLREGFAGVAVTRGGRVLFAGWGEVRQVAAGGAERVLARRNERDRLIGESERAVVAEQAAQERLQAAQARLGEAEAARERTDAGQRDADRRLAEAAEAKRRAGWLIEQRRAAPEQGPLAVRRGQLEGELAAERRAVERRRAEEAARRARIERLRAQRGRDLQLAPHAQRLAQACASAGEATSGLLTQLEQLLAEDRAAGEQVSVELRACAQQEAEIQAALRVEGEAVTAAEVAAQRLRDQAAEAAEELRTVCERLELEPSQSSRFGGDSEDVGVDAPEPQRSRESQEERELQGTPEPRELAKPPEPLTEEQVQALRARIERLARRREQLGPVNPLAADEYAEALAHVQELEQRRTDLETALRELRTVIRETDRQIQETFNETFQAAAHNFEELVGDVFPGGSGRLRLVSEEPAQRSVLGGQSPMAGSQEDGGAGAEAAAEAELEGERYPDEQMLGVEIEITPAGKSSKRLSLLSGGEKSMTALAFLFAVFLARPCPFYVLDEVEAALDDLNLDRFLALLRRYAGRAQFIVITHQKRTMEAADWLYGVSMADNGVSRVLSRRLPPAEGQGQVQMAAVAIAGPPEPEDGDEQTGEGAERPGGAAAEGGADAAIDTARGPAPVA